MHTSVRNNNYLESIIHVCVCVFFCLPLVHVCVRFQLVCTVHMCVLCLLDVRQACVFVTIRCLCGCVRVCVCVFVRAHLWLVVVRVC